jgi:thiamine-phosphate pyrophosphorylase
MQQLAYCIITDRKAYDQPLTAVAQAAEEAELTYFQLREKDLSPSELLILAKQLRERLSKTQFIVNGALDVAAAVGADGVHLQYDNLPVSMVRHKFPKWTIGYSAHSAEEAVHAEIEGASYVFISPVFTPRSKTAISAAIGIDGLQACVRSVRIPVFALGGISAHNLKTVASSGCAGVAGISMFIKDRHFTLSELVV